MYDGKNPVIEDFSYLHFYFYRYSLRLVKSNQNMKQTHVVFISLLIDLLAFTSILPLLPKIFEFYENQNVSDIWVA